MSRETGLLLYFMVAFVLLALPVRRELLATLMAAGRPAAYFASISFVLLVFVQSHMGHGALYPYAAWTMYGEASPSRQAWQVRLLRADGVDEVLDPWRVARGPDARTLMRALENRLGRIRAVPDPVVRQELTDELMAVLTAMVRLEGRRGDRAPTTAVRIATCVLPGDPPWPVGSMECQAFLELTVSPDGRVHAP